MDFKGQKEYVLNITNFLIEHILSMKNVDKMKVDMDALSRLCFQSVCDMLSINYHYYNDSALFDEFTLEQLKNNSRVGEYQAFVDEFVVTEISITRFGKEDLSDLQIQLFADTEDIVAVIEKFDDRIILIKDGLGRELRYQKGNKMFYDRERLHTILDKEDMSLKNAFETYELFKSNGFVVSNQSQLDEGNMKL